jgi:hypothetical protein
VDCLVIGNNLLFYGNDVGRRGLGTHQRMILGSTSRYCTEHAPCNLVIVKHEMAFEEREKNFMITSNDFAVAPLVVQRLEFD